MWENDEIFRKSILTAKNHNERAIEGRTLLEQGKSLSEMQTPITGLSPVEMAERRGLYLEELNKKSPEELEKLLKGICIQLEMRENEENKGTSELHWQRIIILEKLGR